MNCKYCTNEIPEGSKFCRYCGKAMSTNQNINTLQRTKEETIEPSKTKIILAGGVTHEIKQSSNLEQTKKRKTLDQVIGIKGLLVIALIGSLFEGGTIGGTIAPIAYVAGLSVIYYTFKNRNNPSTSRNTKTIYWILIVVWLLEVGMVRSLS